MCGRFILKDPQAAVEYIGVEALFDLRPRFNIAPTQQIPVLQSSKQLVEMKWGIVPSWAQDKSTALINARSESVREKRLFQTSFSHRRCLVPADGFYEWTKIGKRPHLFRMNEGRPFVIGGFWEEVEGIPQCCLLTTSANAVLEPIHNRMPVIVKKEDWNEWFAPGELADEGFQRITAPYPAVELSALAVSPIVNSARIDDARCIEPLPPTLGF